MVADLLGAFRDWWGYSVPDDEAMLASVERLIADPATTEFLLGGVDSGSGPVGVCQLRFRHSVWTGSDDAWLEDLYVRDSARGTGLGRALTEFAFARSRERGCVRIQLDVNLANAPAKSLYESLGFSPWSSSLGADTLMMTRSLS